MHYVIIGGVAAGMSAAMEINRTDEEARITVLERGEDYSYGQCGLPYVINEVIPSIDRVVARRVETFREKYGIDARINTEVDQINEENQVVSGFDTVTKERFEVAYDRLLIASGASPIFPNWDGSHLRGLHVLKTLDDTEGIMSDLDHKVKDVTVIGGGYIGLEMVETFVSLGKKVRLIQMDSQVAPTFDPDMAELIHEKAKEQGVELHLGEAVTGFEGDERVQSVITDKGTYATDLVLVAVGIRPNTQFLKGTTVKLNPQGAVYVNSAQETNVKNIYAAGDCATSYHRIKKEDDYVALGTIANRHGRIAGANMAGNPLIFNGTLGTSIVKFFDLDLGRTGVSETEANTLKIPYRVQKLKANSIAGYYPGGGRMTLKVLSHEETGQLLGGQIIGTDGVDKRIDVLATALHNEMTVQELVDLDLSYAPPYNGVWDPLQQISRRSYSK